MKVLVCGSREWSDWPRVRYALDYVRYAYRVAPSAIKVIHGGARGADRAAALHAEDLGYTVQKFRADWEKYGKSAGIRRNIQMLDEKPDLVLAFWDGQSNGTRHTIETAHERGIPVVVYL